jgi:hypothetical protein
MRLPHDDVAPSEEVDIVIEVAPVGRELVSMMRLLP